MKLTLLLSLIPMLSLLGMIYAEAALIQSKKLVTTAPKDVQAALLDHKERFHGQHKLGWRLLIVCVIAFLGAFLYGALDGREQGYTFWQFFERFLTMLYLEKAFDIICLDYILLTKTNFFQHYFPETAHCKGYRQFGFNRREQVGRLIAYPFLAAALAEICMLF